tara:strand:- start:37 stop:207 length:171 start_codon:yes stop_codon:yes gene_type:complete
MPIILRIVEKELLIDPFMQKVAHGSLGLTDKDNAILIPFLRSLSDYDFINNNYKND